MTAPDIHPALTAAYNQYRQYAENPAVLYADFILSLGSPKDAARLFVLLTLAHECDVILHLDHYRAAAESSDLPPADKAKLLASLDAIALFNPLPDTPENQTAYDARNAEIDAMPSTDRWVAPLNDAFNWLLPDEDLLPLLEAMGSEKEFMNMVDTTRQEVMRQTHEPG